MLIITNPFLKYRCWNSYRHQFPVNFHSLLSTPDLAAMLVGYVVMCRYLEGLVVSILRSLPVPSIVTSSGLTVGPLVQG